MTFATKSADKSLLGYDSSCTVSHYYLLANKSKNNLKLEYYDRFFDHF